METGFLCPSPGCNNWAVSEESLVTHIANYHKVSDTIWKAAGLSQKCTSKSNVEESSLKLDWSPVDSWLKQLSSRWVSTATSVAKGSRSTCLRTIEKSAGKTSTARYAIKSYPRWAFMMFVLLLVLAEYFSNIDLSVTVMFYFSRWICQNIWSDISRRKSRPLVQSVDGWCLKRGSAYIWTPIYLTMKRNTSARYVGKGSPPWKTSRSTWTRKHFTEANRHTHSMKVNR